MPKGPNRGSAVDLRDLRVDARAMSAEDFEDRHGSAFLLLTATELSVPQGPATTEVRLLLDDEEVPGASTANLSLLAFPVRRTGRAVGHLIAIGRSSNNDVAVPDLSISRFHAFLKEAEGSWLIQDAGSTNGTSVNGNHVPQQGHGAPVSLKAGDNVRLGQVELTFLGAKEMHGFALKFER
jgi:hypothetical protein